MKNTTAAVAALAAAILAGCSTFRPMMKDAFVDDDGLVVVVEYGEMSKPYKYKVVSPMNGVELECADRKLVKVTLPEPNGSTLSFYICQNESPKGTMYSTRDGKWRFLTIGVSCRIYLWSSQDNDYLLVFEGKNTPGVLEEMGL
jgi:hypothetical protein